MQSGFAASEIVKQYKWTMMGLLGVLPAGFKYIVRKEKYMKSQEKNAYFTVEAALVVPVVLSTMLFVIYMLLFQYNRCLMEQDLGAMVIWGSGVEVSDETLFEEKTRERMRQMYRDKYVAWEFTMLNAVLQKNHFSVKGGGQLTFPFSGWNFWIEENTWGTEMDYECRRVTPAMFIRLCRGDVYKGAEEGENDEEGEDGEGGKEGINAEEGG